MYQTELGHLDEASETLETLKKLDPDSPQASTGLGMVAMMSGQN